MKEQGVQEQMEIIDKLLDVAIENGLELEVIYFALKHAKENPDTTPAESFLLGVTEWIK
jgi:hypothetical protein